MKIKSHINPFIWYERVGGEIVIHETDSDRVISAPEDIALDVLHFKKKIMYEMKMVLERKEKTCEVCGSPFVSGYERTMTCCESCQRVRRRAQTKTQSPAKPRNKAKRKDHLTEKAVEAKRAGLSYGDLVARQTVELYGKVEI